MYLQIRAGSGSSLIGVGIEGFSAPEPSALINAVRETLIDDLNNSGIFQVATLPDSLTAQSPLFQRWKAAGASCYLEGISIGIGNSVAVKLNDVVTGLTRIDAEYRIEKNRPWYTAHVIVDDMIQIYNNGIRGSFASQISYIGPGGEIYTVDADGRGKHQLTFSKTMKLTTAWSPQGDRIAYSSVTGSNWSIATINVNTGQSQMTLHGGGQFISPAWGPAASDALAFSSNRDGNNEIYIARPNGSGIRRMTNSPGIDVSPSWAPDGSKIVFASDRESPSRPVIYLMNSDGSDQHRLTAIPGSYEDSPCWSPRGDRIAFVIRSGSTGADIATASPTGEDVVQLTVGEGTNETPKWSSDGLRIVFSSTRNGGKNLFIMNWDGTGIRPLTNEGNCQSPSWAPSVSGDDIRITKR